jgi:hypothetical protein
MADLDVLAHTCVIVSDLWSQLAVQNQKHDRSDDEY